MQGGVQPLQANTMDAPLLQRAASDSMLPQFSTLGMQNSILVSGRMGRLQESDRFVLTRGWGKKLCWGRAWGKALAGTHACADATHAQCGSHASHVAFVCKWEARLVPSMISHTPLHARSFPFSTPNQNHGLYRRHSCHHLHLMRRPALGQRDA